MSLDCAIESQIAQHSPYPKPFLYWFSGASPVRKRALFAAAARLISKTNYFRNVRHRESSIRLRWWSAGLSTTIDLPCSHALAVLFRQAMCSSISVPLLDILHVSFSPFLRLGRSSGDIQLPYFEGLEYRFNRVKEKRFGIRKLFSKHGSSLPILVGGKGGEQYKGSLKGCGLAESSLNAYRATSRPRT